MYCKRCDNNVPDFVWVEGDHLVLLEHPITITRDDDIPNNMVRLTATVKTQTRMCSDVFSNIMDEETIAIPPHGDFVVTHLAEEIPVNATAPPPGLFIACCTGKYARFFAKNDTRPRVLCEACRQKILSEVDADG